MNPAQPSGRRTHLPAAGVGAVRGGQLGLALQLAVRPGTGESAAALPPARDLPARGAALLVAGDRRRSGPMAACLSGPPLLPVPGHAPELVPGRGADE